MRILAILSKAYSKPNLQYCFSHQSKKKYFFKVQQKPEQLNKQVLPSQYPKNLSDNIPAIRRSRPVRYITPQHQIQQNKLVQNAELVIAEKYNGKWVSPPNAYSLNVGLIGPVNSGKSQLLGKIIGKKISAVSPKANTTTDTIQAFKAFQIQSEDRGLKNVQLKFYDTAGMMYRKTGFISKGWKVLSQIDFSLLVIDSTKRFDQMTKQAIKRLESHRNYQNFMKALVLNKIDLVENRRKFHSLIGQIEKYGKFDKIFYVSALTGYGIQQLEQYLIKMAKQRQWEQPKEALTSLTQLQIYEEMMKQCLYHRSYKQVPYSAGIQCVSISTKSNNIVQIHFKLTIESENQQRMIIGSEGRNIKWMIQRFKKYFAQAYKRQAQVHIDVRIRKKNKQNQYLSEQTQFDQQTQKRFNQQKIAVVQQYLHHQGKFREGNMMQWGSFLGNSQKQISSSNKLSLPTNNNMPLQDKNNLDSNPQLPFKNKRKIRNKPTPSSQRVLKLRKRIHLRKSN